MYLAFRRARADRAPGNEVGDVLGRHHVEKFARHRHAGFVEVEQELARNPQTLVDAEAAVEAGIVDEAFPADRRAGLFEVHAHQHEQIIVEPVLDLEQSLAVFLGSLYVMHGTRPDDDDEPVVRAVKYAVYGVPRFVHDTPRLGGDREFAQDLRGQGELLDTPNPYVIGVLCRGFRIGRLGVCWKRGHVSLAAFWRNSISRERLSCIRQGGAVAWSCRTPWQTSGPSRELLEAPCRRQVLMARCVARVPRMCAGHLFIESGAPPRPPGYRH